MDPYLEHPKLWPAFQHQLLACLYQILLPGLVDRYRARVGTRTYVSEMPLFTSIIREQYTEEFIEIRNRTDGKLVTLLEVVSPANKTTPAGRQAYLDARQQAIAQKAGIVEIDLVMQGKPTLNYSRDGLPEYDYAVTVTRSNAPDRYEIYTATIQKRCPSSSCRSPPTTATRYSNFRPHSPAPTTSALSPIRSTTRDRPRPMCP